jgi:hypothetical protein
MMSEDSPDMAMAPNLNARTAAPTSPLRRVPVPPVQALVPSVGATFDQPSGKALTVCPSNGQN